MTPNPKLQYPCPACHVTMTIDLIALTKEGHATCTSCGRRMSTRDVARAIHSPRKAVA